MFFGLDSDPRICKVSNCWAPAPTGHEETCAALWTSPSWTEGCSFPDASQEIVFESTMFSSVNRVFPKGPLPDFFSPEGVRCPSECQEPDRCRWFIKVQRARYPESISRDRVWSQIDPP